MKVLLIYPVSPAATWPRGLFRSRWVPTGVAQIATELRHAGHEVRVLVREEQLIKKRFDWAAADAELRQLLEDYRPEMVGLSVVTPALPETAAIAQLAKALVGPHVLVVVGGPHPSALPEQTLAECPAVDVVAVGEGEATLVELAENGVTQDVKGVAFRRDDRCVQTPPRPPSEDLDGFQPIAYDLFDMPHYTSAHPWLIRWLTLSATNLRTSRGCPNRCRFCAGHVVAGLGVRFHSPQYVLERMEDVVNRFGVEAILFEDETLGADPERLLELCEGIRRRDLHRKIRWSGCLRVGQAEPTLLAEMKAAGCIQIEYGFETGSEAMLRRLGKNTGIEENRRAVRLTRAAGMRVFADIMVGLPGETKEDLNATVRFLRWARPDIVSASRLTPLPGTPVYNELTDEQRKAISWDGYSYLDYPGFKINLTAMPDEQFEQAYRRFMKYVVRPMLDRHLLRDTPKGNQRRRKALRKKIRRFAVRHPIRTARLPG